MDWVGDGLHASFCEGCVGMDSFCMSLTYHWLTITKRFVRHVPGRHRFVVVLGVIVDVVGDNLALLRRRPVSIVGPVARVGQSVALINTIGVEPRGV